MTSNAGSNKKDGSLGFGRTENELVKEKVMKSLKEFLRPEFISRIDEIIVFNKLTHDDYVKIAALIIDEYKESLKERDIKLSYDKNVLELLAEKVSKGSSGARDLRNVIRKEVEDKISMAIVKNESFDIGDISLKADSEGISVVINKPEK